MKLILLFFVALNFAVTARANDGAEELGFKWVLSNILPDQKEVSLWTFDGGEYAPLDKNIFLKIKQGKTKLRKVVVLPSKRLKGELPPNSLVYLGHKNSKDGLLVKYKYYKGFLASSTYELTIHKGKVVSLGGGDS